VAVAKRPTTFGALTLLFALGISSSALAVERWDHRGSLGLFFRGGFAGAARVSVAAGSDLQPKLPLDLGTSWGFSAEGNELHLYARLFLSQPPPHGGAIALGYRGYFGDDRVKTFVDLDGMVHVAPAFNVGPRLSFGAMYELAPIVGVSLGVGAYFGGGSTFLFVADAIVGLQFRSYLFD
jgi:hypothetical protein